MVVYWSGVDADRHGVARIGLRGFGAEFGGPLVGTWSIKKALVGFECSMVGLGHGGDDLEWLR